MKKIIVFGATGKVGNYVVDYMKKYFENENFEIIASGRRVEDCSEVLGVKYYPVDITTYTSFAKLPQKDVYAVISLAAQLPTKSDGQNTYIQLMTNTIGAGNVLEYCRKIGADRLLFTQTVFDFGNYLNKNLVLKENWIPNFSYTDDHAVYVIAKNAAIELMEHYYQKYGLKKFVFRLPTIYAYNAWPYMYKNGKKVMRPVYKLINKAIHSENIEIWGDPNYSKDMVHVYDFAQMLCKAILVDTDKAIYNVGTGKPVTLEEQIKTIVDVFSPKDNPSVISYRPDLKSGGGCKMDIKNSIEQLGYIPKYNCRDIFEDFKKEMELNRFCKIRSNEKYQ